jgi:hypothetical protein
MSSSSENSEVSENSDISNSTKSKNSGDVDRKAQCIRNVANFSKVKSFHLMEKGDFSPELLNMYIENAAPKIKALFEKIQKLDEQDMRVHKKHFKHMIFTDVKSSSYGAKILASSFLAKGFEPAIRLQGSGFSLLSDEKLLDTKGKNFGVLMSKNFFDRPMNIKFRKNILSKYNERPNNVHGDLMRFIILDQGFKEGIDLFDVKYVHLFEPLVVKADEKQAIGRSTRFCGQKALEFHPRYGWPLYVFRYEVIIPEKYQKRLFDSKQMFDLFLKFSNLDLRKVVFASELEKASIGAAVDLDLTRNIHQFSIELPPPILQQGGAVLRSSEPTPPKRILNLSQMHQYISKGFSKFKYTSAKLENLCPQNGGNTGQIVSFTPTQDFVRHYFQPSSAYKGILLFHSVGTGKTCSAIATATTSFEPEGYTILWVTRHTLKSDIWKNMYNQVCSLVIQKKLKDKTLKLPAKISGPMKYVSKNWMEPISYKQFSNMLLKRNKIYEEIVRRNGKQDPLRKTLVIIDEAHKIYSPTVASSEKPDTTVLEEMVQNSYRISGKDSVRILAMTGTPYTEDGMEMIKLLNLLREKNDQLASDFDKFSKEYLDDNGFFRKPKLAVFQDKISGYISYLNRSQDARNFAHPVLENVEVELTTPPEDDDTANKYKEKVAELKNRIKELKGAKKEYANQNKDKIKDLKSKLKEEGKGKIAECIDRVDKKAEKELEKINQDKERALEDCKSKPVKERKECKEKILENVKARIEKIKEEKKLARANCKDDGKVDIKTIKKDDPNIEKELEKLKEELDKIKEHNAASKAIMKEVKVEKLKLKEKKLLLKNLTNSVLDEKSKIKGITNKADKKISQKHFRENLNKQFKELKHDILDIRNKISKKLNERKSLLIRQGKKSIGDISQLTALEKNCLKK